MRIVDIREKTVSIASPIANAYIDFSKMTCPTRPASASRRKRMFTPSCAR
ncbi:MAG: hypothetical protein WAN43_15640 [Rhodomicrobium sp.]